MKKITYQIILNDNDYLECMEKIAKLILFPVKGNMTFKIEEIGGEDSRAIIVNGVAYSSWEDYRKCEAIKKGEAE